MPKVHEGPMLFRDQAEAFHAAARIIQTDGCDGIHAAIKIVGHEIALAMLLMFQRCEHYDKKVYPIPEDVTHSANRVMVQSALLTLQFNTPEADVEIVLGKEGHG